jgi:nucleoside-diphosphate-sugar epimerase
MTGRSSAGGVGGRCGRGPDEPRAEPQATAALRPGSTVLVTGAAGFIGSRLVERLLELGHAVIGVDSFTDYYSPATKRANLAAAIAASRFQLVEVDLATASLDELVEGVDAVCHLAGQPGVRGSWGSSFETYLQRNVLASQRLLEALTRSPVPTVMASSSSVYGCAVSVPVTEKTSLRPVSPYGMTKAAVEQLVGVYRRDRGLPVVVVRYFTVFGPRQRPDMAFQRFIAAASGGAPIRVFGSGEQSRDFTFVDDAVSATIATIGAPSPVYNVGGGVPATVNDVLSLISQLTARELDVVQETHARGDVMHTWADTTLVRTELAWHPNTSLADGLAAQVTDYQRRHAEVVTV